MKKTLLLGLSTLLVTISMAQNPGELDKTFGVDGFATDELYSKTGELFWDMMVLSDDKILGVGQTKGDEDTDILIAKFMADGTLDTDFGKNGYLAIDLSIGGNESARGIAELGNGQLLITGFVQNKETTDGYVARLNADGTLDASFGTSNGHTKFNTGDKTSAYGQVVLTSGTEIYVAGAAYVDGQLDIVLVKLTQGGGINESFASAGYATLDLDGNDQLRTMDRKANGSFVFGGTTQKEESLLGFVAMLSQFGTPATFGTDGSYTFDMGSGYNEVNDLYVDENDYIVFTGDEGLFPNVNGFIQRLTPEGALDDSYASDGIMNSDPGSKTALLFKSVSTTPDGNIVAVGSFSGESQSIYAMMTDASGKLVGDFGGNGDVIVPFKETPKMLQSTAGSIQSDGGILLCGYYTSADTETENIFVTRISPLEDNTSSLGHRSNEVITIYPNPASKAFRINTDQVSQVQLFTLQGQMVQAWNRQAIYSLSENIASGTYLLKIENGSSIGYARINIQ